LTTVRRNLNKSQPPKQPGQQRQQQQPQLQPPPELERENILTKEVTNFSSFAQKTFRLSPVAFALPVSWETLLFF
jgi:hypothetical protein